MKKKSAIEDLLEIAFKHPVAGVVLSIIFAGLGLYLANRQAQASAKPSETLFLPMMHMFGKISYLISVIVLIVAGIGFIVAFIKMKKHKPAGKTRTIKDMIDSSKNQIDTGPPVSNAPRFNTKEEYFRWKDSVMKTSSDKDLAIAAPQRVSDDVIDPSYQTGASKQEQNEVPDMKSEKPAWPLNSIYDALGRVDWYQFEKFSAALLHNEGYTVERKGGAHPDGGIDLIASKDGETILVQCKHWKKWTIKPKVVREMVGTMMIYQTNKGAIYTLNKATKAAQELATQQGIQIEEGYGLAERALRQLSKEQLDVLLDTSVHHCPKCEAEMILRRGVTFQPFWGCSRYREGCRGKLEYTDTPDRYDPKRISY